MYFIAELKRMFYICDKQNHTIAYAEKAKRFEMERPKPSTYQSVIADTFDGAVEAMKDYVRGELSRFGVNPSDFWVTIAVEKAEPETGAFWASSMSCGSDYTLKVE